MTTTKLMANSPQEELTLSTTKRVWVKPTVDVISVESGTRVTSHEGTVPNGLKPNYHS